MESENCYKFLKKRHIAFLRRCLSILPQSAVSYDTSRMTVLFFALSGLDILGALEEIPKNECEEIIEWIYTLQLTSSDGHKYGGFRGGHCISNIFAATPTKAEGPQGVPAGPNSKSSPAAECNGHSMNSAKKDNLLDIRLSEGQIPAKILRQFAPAHQDNSPSSNNSPSSTPLRHDQSKGRCFSPSNNCGASRNASHLDRDLDSAHIAMTYSALASLVVLGDDLRRVDKQAVLRHVASLQCPDGSFFSNCGGSENDLRFVYCAAVVCYLLGDMQAINASAAIRYVKDCLVSRPHVPWFNDTCKDARRARLRAARAFKRRPTTENEIAYKKAKSKCRYIFKRARLNSSCSLSMEELHGLVRWLLMRQENEAGRVATEEINILAGGIQGRPNKPADTCYTFWIGAALKMLGCADMLDKPLLQQFVLSTQDPLTGGLSKHSNGQPDGMHTFLGLSGLAVLGLHDELNKVDPALNITLRAKSHWKSLKMDER
ncbi:PFTB repeat [Trinorchestia longiramus]|nr:PFTB repeat [Trinorchestia longiramus]